MARPIVKTLVKTLAIPSILSPLLVHAQALEEVLVTAQKRTESLQEVPISITAVSSDTLATAGITDVKNLEQLVPGFIVGNDGTFANPTIRGVGSALAGPGQSANVATYIDGFYRPSQLTSNVEFLDVESLQVLKGPQGTLFGRNATGGAVLINTKTPQFEPEADLRLGYGSYNEASAAFYGTAPITENVAGSISAYYRGGDGHIENVVTGSDDIAFRNHGVRAKLLWRASDTANFLLAIDHLKNDDPWPMVTGLFEGRSTAMAFPGAIDTDGRRKVASDGDTESRAEATGVSLKAEFDLDWATFTSYTQYRDEKTDIAMDIDGTNITLFHAKWSPEQETFSQEFNLGGETGDFDWVVGLYYFDDDTVYPNFAIHSMGLPDYVPGYGAGVETQAWAAFTDVTWNFTDRWYLTLGLRYSEETQEGFYETHEWFEQGLGGAAPVNLDQRDLKETWEAFTPRLVLRYEVTDYTSVYASFSQGFKAGAFNTNGFQDAPVDQEEIDAFEIGMKTAGDSWRMEAAAFYYDYSDLQTAVWTSFNSLVENAAKAEIYGADVHVTASLSDSLTLDFGAAYTHSEYDEFPDGVLYDWSEPVLGPLGPVGGVTLVSPHDVTGNQMIRTPEFSGNIGITHRVPLGVGELTSTVNYAYQSRIYFDTANAYSQDPYGLLNLRVGWRDENRGFGVSVFCNNATDEEYVNQNMLQSLFIGQSYGKPRTFGVELTKAW